jgi:membrane-bound lytic murein transglycosylase MltF
MKRVAIVLVALACLSLSSCSPSGGKTGKSTAASASGQSAEEAALPPPTYEQALPPAVRPTVDRAYTGDLDGMIAHRIIRVGAPFNRTYYFIDKGVQRGLSYEYATLFEDQLNKKLATDAAHKVHVILLPMPRDMLIPQLNAGKLDMVVAQLTITPERQKVVDFTAPTRTNVSEVLVTGPATTSVKSLDDLAKTRVYVRKSSSYYASLQAANQQRKAQGKPSIDIEPAAENLEDDDLLEMVNAGLIPATVVDDYLANYWKKMLPDLTVHEDVAFRTGGSLAVAIRKGSPKLAAELNGFIAQNGLNSAIGAVINKRYLQSTDYVKNAASLAERKKFLDMVALFRKYGDEYKFDYLLMAAQAYQESRLNQDAKSHVGAVGVMQLMPKTGDAQDVGNIRQLEPNIHAGVKYMRFMRDQYFANEPMDDLNKGLFTFASYNAGAGRIASLRREAQARGLNPNVWFGNVERVASERIGRETVTYVSNIYKYYLAYKLISEETRARNAAKAALSSKAAR